MRSGRLERLDMNLSHMIKVEILCPNEVSRVPDEDAEKLQTVGDVVKYIEGRAKQQ